MWTSYSNAMLTSLTVCVRARTCVRVCACVRVGVWLRARAPGDVVGLCVQACMSGCLLHVGEWVSARAPGSKCSGGLAIHTCVGVCLCVV